MGKNHDKFRYVEVAIPLDGALLQHLEQVERETNISVNQSLLLYAKNFFEMTQRGVSMVTTANGTHPTSTNGAQQEQRELVQVGFGGANDDDLDAFEPD
ncbi:MAG: hypothetical protein J2P37_00265 [Ktedonobacteraceae bacterium]|nr:hypothetical protein [Ktedonobacteraceae bacterium]